LFDDTAAEIVEYLLTDGYLEPDGPFLHIGPEAERRFGRRYFSRPTAVFTAPPEFLVLAGRVEIGSIGTDMLTEELKGPRVLLLGGRSWKVTHVDWERRRCLVEVVDGGGRAKWSGSGASLSYEIMRGMRDVLLGALPESVTFTSRACAVLGELRQSYSGSTDSDRLIVRLPSDSTGRWWTWAGTAANRSLQTSLRVGRGFLIDHVRRSHPSQAPRITLTRLGSRKSLLSLLIGAPGPGMDRQALGRRWGPEASGPLGGVVVRNPSEVR
jgi:ATP-dependent Lhr-like helicase